MFVFFHFFYLLGVSLVSVASPCWIDWRYSFSQIINLSTEKKRSNPLYVNSEFTKIDNMAKKFKLKLQLPRCCLLACFYFNQFYHIYCCYTLMKHVDGFILFCAPCWEDWYNLVVYWCTVLQRVGFIGLGNMGSRMADNLVKSGYSVVVHDM